MLVIDDASPDGTGELADRLAGELGYVDVLHRPAKEGLGPAYIAGFRTGARATAPSSCSRWTATSRTTRRDVPRLIAAAEDGRRRARLPLRRGRTRSRTGDAMRRAISTGGSLYARLLLGVSIRDLTGGFKCYRRAVLEATDLDAVSSVGYAFQIETTYRALRAGFRVVEVPIAFVDRRGRALEDEQADRARGGLARTGSPPPGSRPAGCRHPVVKEVTDATFEDDVLRAEQPVVVDFWAPWCGPCRAVEPILEQLSAEHPQVAFAKLNIDENPGFASRYGVLSIPTAILFDGGEPQETVIGARPRSHYEQVWSQWLDTEPDQSGTRAA